MSPDTWAAILFPAALSLLGAAGLGAWRWWHGNEYRELRRIYKRAAGQVSSRTVRAHLTELLREDVFWRSLSPPESRSPAEEKAHVREALDARARLVPRQEIQAALDMFFRDVYRGLADGRCQRWRDRARTWEVAQAAGLLAVLPVASAATTHVPPWDPPPSTVSSPAVELVGRADELSALITLVTTDSVRLTTVTGSGGVGKTLLTRHVASRAMSHFDQRVYWVSLSAVAAGEAFRVGSLIARALGIQQTDQVVTPEESTGRPESRTAFWLDAVATALGDARLLVVLDNFEHIVDAAQDVASLLDRCPRLAVLVTSRRPLRLYNLEHEFPVMPLALPDAAQPAAELAHFPAVVLFLQRAQQRTPSFRLTEDNARLVAEICRDLDGLPYMIEVAAPLLKYYGSLELLRKELGSAGALSPLSSSHQASGVEPRHANAIAVTAWSYELLNPHRQLLFRRLGVFVDTFDLDAANAVCAPDESPAELMDDMAWLIDDNLVQLESGGHAGHIRYHLLDTTRECALLILNESGEFERVADRHARHYLTRATEAATKLAGEDAEEVLESVRYDQEDLRAAFTRFMQHDADAALRMAWALSMLLDRRGRRMEARDVLDRALHAMTGGQDQGSTQARIRALDQAALLATKIADTPKANEYAQRMLELSRKTGSRADVGEALLRLARNMYFLGDFGAASRLLVESASNFSALGRTGPLAAVEFELGNIDLDHDRLREAREHFEKSLAFYADGPNDDQGRLCVYLAYTCRKLGDVQASRRYIADAERLVSGENYYRWYLHFHGRIALDDGEPAAARKYFSQSAALFLERQDRLGVVRSLLGFAYLAAVEGNWAEAVGVLEQERALRTLMGLPFPHDWEAERTFIEAGAAKHLSEDDIVRVRENASGLTWEQVRDVDSLPLKAPNRGALMAPPPVP